MNTIKSFNPIAHNSARILILGSMPGVKSLNANQYYAHPQNAFWRIMANIFNISADQPYDLRVAALKESGVAIWDVLHACVRPGSLDSAIQKGSRVPNDFQNFFMNHPNIQKVGFNGTEAEKSFNRYVLPNINSENIHFVRLPSSSPAHAVSLEKKVNAWREMLGV